MTFGGLLMELGVGRSRGRGTKVIVPGDWVGGGGGEVLGPGRKISWVLRELTMREGGGWGGRGRGEERGEGV